MQNPGKRFEEDFKNSVPDEVFYYRFRDGTANWGGQQNENTRFQAKNICDCMLNHHVYGLHFLELKSHLGKSFPFSAFGSEKRMKLQIKDLTAAASYTRQRAGYIFNMRDLCETWYLSVKAVSDFIDAGTRKSIPLDYMRSHGVRVCSQLKRVRYRYDVMKFLEYVRKCEK